MLQPTQVECHPEPSVNGVLTSAPAPRQLPRRRPARRHAPKLPGWLQLIGLLALLQNAAHSPDLAGNVVQTTNPLGKVWDYVYDSRNRKVQEFAPAVTDGDSNDSAYNTSVRPNKTWIYDAVGLVKTTIDARGNSAGTLYETDMHYDAANRVVEVDQPEVPVDGGSLAVPITYTTYDKNGNVLTVEDPNSHTVTNTYDLLNRLTKTVDGVGITVKYNYDQVGNRTLVVDGLGQSTAFAYDGLNRNTQITDAAGNATRFKYNALNKTQRIDALGQVTSYFYDLRNRLMILNYASSDAANSERDYVYDKVGNLLSVTEPSKTAANVSYTYDLLNRVVTEVSGGKTNAYTYDLAGNRTGTVYDSGGTSRTITSAYDDLNRLHTLTEGSRVTTYAYDLNGNITSKTLPHGSSTGDVETATFDALNRIHLQGAVNSSSTLLYNYTYGYDLAGNDTKVIESYPSSFSAHNRTVTNTYDNDNRLTEEAVSGGTTTTYVYDFANNRTSKAISGGATTTNTYNNLDQLITAVTGGTTLTYAYDANGNRYTRGDGTYTDTYTYDFENRLIQLVKNTSGGAGTYAYTYDYRSRRILRDESAISGHYATKLVFSGGTSVREYDVISGTPTLTVELIRGSDYGGGIGGVLYTIRGGGSPTYSYTHENRRGDVVAQTDGATTMNYQAQYEAFGKRPAETGSTSDRQRANTKDEDPTGLLDEGHRYRDLETGSFITRDPMGFVDGPNLYTYVRQNPWSAFDPEGLTMEDLHQYWVGIGNGFIGIGQGAVHAVEHPIDTAQGVASAVAHPINTAVAVKDAAVKSYNSGPEGQGELTANVLAVLAPGTAATKLFTKVEKSASELKVTSEVAAQEFKGGLHGDTKLPVGDGLESHHMPPDSVSPVSTNKGTAIQMDPADHMETSSHGSNGAAGAEYRQGIKDMIDGGQMRDAMATEVRDVRRASKVVSGDATKYNSAMQQMLKTGKEEGNIPPNPKRSQ